MATAVSPSSSGCSKTTGDEGENYDKIQEKVRAAFEEAASVLTRPTSIAAREFFGDNENGHDEDSDSSNGFDEIAVVWKTLPWRLAQLEKRLMDLVGIDADVCKPGREQTLRSVPEQLLTRKRLALTASVMVVAPASFIPSIRTLLAKCLNERQKQWEKLCSSRDESSSQDENVNEEDCDDDGDAAPLERSEMCAAAITDESYRGEKQDQSSTCRFFDDKLVYHSLRALGWLPPTSRLLDKALALVVHDVTDKMIRDKIMGNYEEYGLVNTVNIWKEKILKRWLVSDVIYVRRERSVQHNHDIHFNDDNRCEDDSGWGQRIDFIVADAIVRIREEEIFDIVADYPDSKPAVEELRDTLNIIHGRRSRLASSLRQSLQRRLLHPGAKTSQILDVYINTIKVLQVIDPTEDILECVAQPVREYLQSRPDTVRCIITGLTDGNAGGDLYEELRRQDTKPLENTPDSDDDDDPPPPDWQPKSTAHQLALVATPDKLRTLPHNGRNSDILAMLVGIYGSQQLFVNEYRIMLADKLLSNLKFDTDKEVHTLELLKLRFGEASMRQCEIMIKDIDDSKRIIANIHATLSSKAAKRSNEKNVLSRLRSHAAPKNNSATNELHPVVDAAIISHIFWPALMKNDLVVHPRMQEKLDQFETEYANLKNPRRLIWMKQLGSVEVEIDAGCDGEARSFTCSPLLATLISHFGDRHQWTADDLATATGVSTDTVQKKMGYWISNHVISTTRATSRNLVYEVNEDGTDALAATSYEEDDDNVANAKGQSAEEMRVYESYIFGMLTNLGQLPLDRIHNMLKMFVSGSDHKYDKTPQELGAFLQLLCGQDKLECGPDGLFKLLKK